jgi:hypothetical protein
MAKLFVFIGPLLLGLVLWMLLDRHERRRAAAGLSRHSGKRLAVIAFGLLLSAFALVFAVLLSFTMAGRPDGPSSGIGFVVAYAGPPLAAGVVICWLSMRRKASIPRKP